MVAGRPNGKRYRASQWAENGVTAALHTCRVIAQQFSVMKRSIWTRSEVYRFKQICFSRSEMHVTRYASDRVDVGKAPYLSQLRFELAVFASV